MKKDKNMKHPMYNDKVYAQLYKVYKEKRPEFELMAGTIGRQAIGMKIHANTMAMIEKEGHILVDIENDEWESDISKKTISMLTPNDINFPFDAGAIIDRKSDSGVIFFAKHKDHLDVSFEVVSQDGKEKGIMSQRISADSTFEEALKTFESHVDEVYRVISVLMYIAVFKRERNRVIETTTNKLKSSKKRAVPSHRIHMILLRQPGSSSVGTSDNRKSDKNWLVRGHWRNQWYATQDSFKLKWIDKYWKGSGKEKIEKIYKV